MDRHEREELIQIEALRALLDIAELGIRLHPRQLRQTEEPWVYVNPVGKTLSRQPRLRGFVSFDAVCELMAHGYMAGDGRLTVAGLNLAARLLPPRPHLKQPRRWQSSTPDRPQQKGIGGSAHPFSISRTVVSSGSFYSLYR